MTLKVLDQSLLVANQLFKMRHLMTPLRSEIEVRIIICIIFVAENFLDCGLHEHSIIAASSHSEATVLQELVLLIKLFEIFFSLFDVSRIVIAPWRNIWH